MGTVFKKMFTKPLPAGAEIFVRKGERFARWKDRRGKSRTAPLTVGEDGSERITLESPFYVAKWRDGAGVVRTEATGCKDETAARQMLADLERRAELVCSGVMSAAEAIIGDHQGEPLPNHVGDYLLHLEASGVSAKHLYEIRRQLSRLAADCGFGRLAWNGQSRLSRQQWIRTPAARANGSAGITFGCRPRKCPFPSFTSTDCFTNPC